MLSTYFIIINLTFHSIRLQKIISRNTTIAQGYRQWLVFFKRLIDLKSKMQRRGEKDRGRKREEREIVYPRVLFPSGCNSQSWASHIQDPGAQPYLPSAWQECKDLGQLLLRSQELLLGSWIASGVARDGTVTRLGCWHGRK